MATAWMGDRFVRGLAREFTHSQILCKLRERRTRGVGSTTQREHPLSTAVVKHDRAWFPLGWVVVSREAWQFTNVSLPAVKFRADSTPHQSPTDETISRGPV